MEEGKEVKEVAAQTVSPSATARSRRLLKA
jgi:hypothetical protein